MKKSKLLLVLIVLSLIFGFISSFVISDNRDYIYVINISDSYSIWSHRIMKALIQERAIYKYKSSDATSLLNRSYNSMYIEWWIHNIGYYVTRPFCFDENISKINLRCKDVDLEEFI